MTAIIRLATEHDADQIQAIYAPFCRDDSPVSFEFEPPTVDEIRRRIVKTLERFPWLVLENQGELMGYAYAGLHRERAAYAWSVDVSIYVREERRRSGVGRALYSSLFHALRLMGYHNAYAGTTLPNPGSVGLHQAMGFEMVGVYRGVGYKGGAWHDVAWWELTLRERTSNPDLPMSLQEIRKLAGWDAALAIGLADQTNGTGDAGSSFAT
jgi:phosphinothricin acetyltransferase